MILQMAYCKDIRHWKLSLMHLLGASLPPRTGLALIQ